MIFFTNKDEPVGNFVKEWFASKKIKYGGDVLDEIYGGQDMHAVLKRNDGDHPVYVFIERELFATSESQLTSPARLVMLKEKLDQLGVENELWIHFIEYK